MKYVLAAIAVVAVYGHAIASPYETFEKKIGGQSYHCAKANPGICLKDRWLFITRNNKVHYLLDIETASANKSWVKINVHRNDAASFLQLYETDCHNRSLRVAEEFIYSEPDQKGILIHHGKPTSDEDSKWQTPAPNTILDTILKSICAFRSTRK